MINTNAPGGVFLECALEYPEENNAVRQGR